MNYLVLDLETEKEFREVGGKQNIKQLGVTVVGVYERSSDEYHAYERHEFSALEKMLAATELLIGFNIDHFDVPVLQPHVDLDLSKLQVLDLMTAVETHLGFRVSLDNLCGATLGARKSGNGLEAILWWRAGEKDKVKEYCLKDVQLTKDLYEFGKEKGYVVADTRDRGRVRVPVEWKNIAPAVQEKDLYVQTSLI